jgi:hypothetical protein
VAVSSRCANRRVKPTGRVQQSALFDVIGRPCSVKSGPLTVRKYRRSTLKTLFSVSLPRERKNVFCACVAKSGVASTDE